MQVRSNLLRRAHTVWVFSILVAVIHLGPNKCAPHRHIFILAEAQQPLQNQHHHVAAVTPPVDVASSSTDSCLDNEIRMAMSEKIASADGFLAALDQSDGSSPNALRAYGVPDDVSFSALTLVLSFVSNISHLALERFVHCYEI
jgi:hypothetical protein